MYKKTHERNVSNSLGLIQKMKVSFLFSQQVHLHPHNFQVLFWKRDPRGVQGFSFCNQFLHGQVDVLGVSEVLSSGCFHLAIAPSGTHGLEDRDVGRQLVE